jgi:hypothetical protein
MMARLHFGKHTYSFTAYFAVKILLIHRKPCSLHYFSCEIADQVQAKITAAIKNTAFDLPQVAFLLLLLYFFSQLRQVTGEKFFERFNRHFGLFIGELIPGADFILFSFEAPSE